jgi:hypothetical protein
MSEIDRSSPNLTDPTVTTRAADRPVLKAQNLCFGAITAAEWVGSTAFGVAFEYQGCAAAPSGRTAI